MPEMGEKWYFWKLCLKVTLTSFRNAFLSFCCFLLGSHSCQCKNLIISPLLLTKISSCVTNGWYKPQGLTSSSFGKLHRKSYVIKIVQYSTAVTLPPITLFSQLRYLELGPKKTWVKLFSSFLPQVTLFSSFSTQLRYPLCFRGKNSATEGEKC